MSALTGSESHTPTMPFLARTGRAMSVNPALVDHMAALDFYAQHERADYNARVGWRPDSSGQGLPAFVPEASDGRGRILNLDGIRSDQGFSSLSAESQLSEARLRLRGVITPDMFQNMILRRTGSAHRQWADAYSGILSRIREVGGQQEIRDGDKRASFLKSLQLGIAEKLNGEELSLWRPQGRNTSYLRLIRPVFSDVSGHERQWSHPAYDPALMTSIQTARGAGTYDLHQFTSTATPREHPSRVKLRPSTATPFTEMESLLSFPEEESENHELTNKMTSALSRVVADESSPIARHPLIEEFQGTGVYPGMTKDHVSLIRVMPTILHRMPNGTTQPHREPVFTLLPHDERKISGMRDFPFRASSYHE